MRLTRRQALASAGAAGIVAAAAVQLPRMRAARGQAMATGVGGKVWFFGQGGLGGVLSAGATAAQLQGAFSISTTPQQHNDNAGNPVNNIPIFNFVNLAATNTPPPAGFGWGLYSQDTTGQTTDAEILDFANSHTTACANIHGYGLNAFTFPANDIMWVYDPAKANSVGQYQAFIDDNMTAKACRHADNIGVQSQGEQGVVTDFSNYINHTEDQQDNVKAMPFFGGLATNRPGPVEFTAQRMADCYNATKAQCAGYWINVNGEPDKVVTFLNLIS
jgi:hypothetical protein